MTFPRCLLQRQQACILAGTTFMVTHVSKLSSLLGQGGTRAAKGSAVGHTFEAIARLPGTVARKAYCV